MSKRMAVFLLLPILVSCAGNRNDSSDDSSFPKSNQASTDASIQELVHDYYIPLSDLGMPLTIYFRLSADSTFLFSNHTSFETDKSSGTFIPSSDSYLMSYTSVNGEKKSIQDGLVSKFIRNSDGSLTFTSEHIYYGSTTPVTSSPHDPSIQMKAYIIPEGYDEPAEESEFVPGTYEATFIKDSISYKHTLTFLQADSTYIDFVTYTKEEKTYFFSEFGSYYLNGNQIAVEAKYPSKFNDTSRIGGEVLNDSSIKLKLMSDYDNNIRNELTATRVKEEPTLLYDFTGTGKDTETGKDISATFSLYSDGTYESITDNYIEDGLFYGAVEESQSYPFLLFPDKNQHHTTSITVPQGEASVEEGKIQLKKAFLRKKSGRVLVNLSEK